MRSGYSEFIDKHKNIFFAIFIFGLVVLWIIPTIFIDLSKYNNATIRDDTFFSFSPLMLCIRGFQSLSICKTHYNEIHDYIDKSFNEYYSLVIKNYADGIISIIFTILILAILIYLAIRFFKTKSISRLIFIPYCLAIISNVAIIITYSVLEPELEILPINLIVTIIISIPVFLYCFKSQRFPSRKPRPHKPTDKERIAELERQVAELQKEKDVE